MPAQVLVADDDPQILRMLTDVLLKRGFNVDTARDGDEAYARAQERAPDVLVTDVMMPKLDGWSLVRKLRLDPKLADLPVIFLTAVTADDASVKAFRLGADDYITKPFKFSDVVTRIEKVLDAKRPPSASGKLASTGLTGDLAQVGLSTLLVLIEMERKTGVLKLRCNDGRAGEVVVRGGKVTDASIDGPDQTTAAQAVHVMLTWSSGKFDFAVRDVDGDDRIGQSTTHLLIEGARLMDEASAPAAEAQLDDEAIAEWGVEERTPVLVAAKLADLVRRTARASNPPYSIPIGSAAPAPAPDLPAIARTSARDLVPLPALPPAPAPVVPKRPASRWWLIAAVVFALAGGATFAIRPSPAQSGRGETELRGDADVIAAAIDRAADAAQLRADGIAAMPLLRAGIETDAATLQDTAANEIFLAPAAGETIEVFQLRDGARASALRLPAGAPAIGVASGVERAAGALRAVASSAIKTQRGSDGGTLAVGRYLDLAAVQTTLATHARGARLLGLAQPLVLVPEDGSAARTVTVPIAARRAPGLALEASLAALPDGGALGWVAPAREASFALAALLLVAYVVLASRARRAGAAP
jgi:CheY-like chemotaxis protein